MADLLVDTDVFIDHLRGSQALKAGERDRLFYSVVTRAELFSGNATEEDAVQSLLAPFTEVAVSREIAELAGRIRRDHNTRMPDALIAASAVQWKLSLRTRNIRDFANIPGLRVKKPS